MKALSAILIVGASLAVLGCVTLTGVEPTDLSQVKLGADRQSIETVLGEPTETTETDLGLVAVYKYNSEEVESVLEHEVFIYYAFMPYLWPFGESDARKAKKEQERLLTILYDTSQKVVWCGPHAQYETIKRSGARLGEVQECVDAQTPSPEHQFSPSDVETLYQIGVELTDRVLAWNFACLAAHLGHQQAQDYLATWYYLGNEPVRKDFVKAYVWYTLAGREKNVVMTTVKSMTLEEIAEAERLVAEWQPNRVECETIRAPAAN